MGTLSLHCPFCCNENFSTRESLRDHILYILNNVTCPKCSGRFDSVYDLVGHLETDCQSSEDIDVKPNCSQEKKTKPDEAEENQATEEETVDETENEPTNVEDEVTYMCVMCNVHFKSIEDHLEKYHAGEEVLLETEEAGTEGEQTFEIEEGEEAEYVNCQNESNFELSSEPIDHDELNRAEEEEQFIDDEGRTYTRQLEADKNTVRTRKVEIHQCTKCSVQFQQFEEYVQHVCFPKKSGRKNRCKHCSATFHSQQSLNAHLKTHIQTQPGESPSKVITLGPHTCEICNTMFPSFKSLRLHVKMHEPQKNKPIESPVNQITNEPDSVRQLFVCHICNNTYDLEYEEAHMKSHSEEENFYCSTCNRKFLTKENLEMHMKAHTNTKKFLCSYCKKSFTNFVALNEHVTNLCQKRGYECQYCGRRFARPHEKVKHERIHTGEKPHICQICGKAFRVSYCLTLHMRTHSGSRPYECPQCNKRFKSHSVYNHHMLIHSEARNYKCPYCPKAFKTSVQLAGHKNSHIKPFSCTECNRPFASLYAVRAHMETHKRENNLKFDCWLCGATYARAFALKDHMKSQHAGESVTEDMESLVNIESVETEQTDHKYVGKSKETSGEVVQTEENI